MTCFNGATMAGDGTLAQLMQLTGALAPVGQGFADRAAGEANAGIYRTQARQALDAAAYDEARARREGRSIIAQQAANVLAEGGGDGSQMDVIRQNEVNLIADALAIRRRGQVEAAGLKSRADMAEYEGEQALYGGIASAGSKLLMTGAERAQREREATKRRAVGV